MDNEFEEWLATRPKVIQELGRKYPPGKYIMSQDAPYGMTCPGTIVEIMAYNESGEIRVGVEPENVLPQAVEHANSILHPQVRDYSEIANQGISAYIDPKYLIPYTPKIDE